MTLPALVFGVVVALLIGSMFHVWLDGGVGRLLLYLLLSVAGFFTGHFFGSRLGWILFPLGPFNLGAAVVGSLLFLGLGHWLSLIEIRRPERSDKV